MSTDPKVALSLPKSRFSLSQLNLNDDNYRLLAVVFDWARTPESSRAPSRDPSSSASALGPSALSP